MNWVERCKFLMNCSHHDSVEKCDDATCLMKDCHVVYDAFEVLPLAEGYEEMFSAMESFVKQYGAFYYKGEMHCNGLHIGHDSFCGIITKVRKSDE